VKSISVVQQERKHILLGHLACFGDCLYATTIAKQIKVDYPSCHLTWAIGSKYRSILDGNPDIDEVWEIPLNSREEIASVWYPFKDEALRRKKNGDFDEIFFTQIYPDNYETYDGTIRSSILRCYRKPITVGFKPVLYLFEQEIKNVYNFVQKNNLLDKKNVILFECSAKSEQSFVTPEFAAKLSQKIVNKIPDCYIIMSSDLPDIIRDSNHTIIDGSCLSFRENAELTKYCSLLLGCSSGISWLSTSSWAKKLPMIQLLKSDKSFYASFIHDHEYHGLPTNHIIEMTDTTVDQVLSCILTVVNQGFTTARLQFHQEISVDLTFYFKTIASVAYNGRPKQVIFSLVYTFRRYGINLNLFKVFIPLTQYIISILYRKITKFINSNRK